MSHVVLVWTEDDGSQSKVECQRVTVPVNLAQVDDFVPCPILGGLFHVHSVTAQGMWTKLVDCLDREHYYASTEVVEIARPTGDASAGCRAGFDDE